MAQFGDRQDFQDPLIVSGAIGVGNLFATGLAWANNREEIDSLRSRVEKLESLLRTTCNKVLDHLPIIFAVGYVPIQSTYTFKIDSPATLMDFSLPDYRMRAFLLID